MSIMHTPDGNHFQSPETDTYFGIIDATQARTLNSFYDEITKALQLPDYFGRNFDALDEVLCDFSWLDYSIIYLIIKNSNELLADEPEHFASFIEVVLEIGNDNFEVIML